MNVTKDIFGFFLGESRLCKAKSLINSTHAVFLSLQSLKQHVFFQATNQYLISSNQGRQRPCKDNSMRGGGTTQGNHLRSTKHSLQLTATGLFTLVSILDTLKTSFVLLGRQASQESQKPPIQRLPVYSSQSSRVQTIPYCTLNASLNLGPNKGVFSVAGQSKLKGRLQPH